MTNRWTDIEISTSDRPGLLASICQVFLKHETVIKKLVLQLMERRLRIDSVSLQNKIPSH
ncbi:MAG: hypothetical protein CM15mP86_16580 [Gammaproteobacteria bacterium]|nr:MAG: hypothetical protein CM15mP86_16580 [Gammaproteobacteria bacterium]